MASLQDTTNPERDALFEASRRWQIINKKIAEGNKLRQEEQEIRHAFHLAQLRIEAIKNELEFNKFDVQSMMEQTAFDMRNALNNRSVIKVVGLPPSLSPSTLHQFLDEKFRDFGEIKNIVFDCLCDGSDKDYTVTAFVQFADSSSAERVISMIGDEEIKYNSNILDISYAF